MDGLMMDRQLLVSRLLWRAERVFPDREVITGAAAGDERFTYAQLGDRVRRLVTVLRDLGIGPGDRVLSLAWNSRRHLEAYFAVPCMGAVLHTGNHRLSPEQLAYTINHAGDRVVLVDPDLLGSLEAVRDRLHTVETVLVLGAVPTGCGWENVHPYDDLVEHAAPVRDLPEFPETTAAAVCYTSGTTGDPKGVLYSHRSTVLHALALCAAGSAAIDPDERVLLATPMSHVNAWGVPYAAALAGATLILPGTHPRPEDLLRLIRQHGASTAVAAVTVGTMMRRAWETAGGVHDLATLRRLWLGGSAPSPTEIEWWSRTAGVCVVNGWGMTETSPMAMFSSAAERPGELQDPAVLDVQARQGRPLPLVEIRIVDAEGAELPWDGETTGELEVMASWAASGYLERPDPDSHRDGWLRTGDVAVFHPDGTMQVKDRTKDLVKSGGEWISSVELENALLGHPEVEDAVVVAVPDPTWVERPVACVVAAGNVTGDDLRSHLAERFPRFWVPDTVLFVETIPRTSVGKLDKKRVRAELGITDDSAPVTS
ncbi:fatty-acyl-CoA synthase [Pseudonocardia ammonioxydans]|uniref:Fatty-acyl-CoA synthase n=1 Tax=Pseudonocardia ammonioxydans TaxID=260086 RepID=A0A1I5GZV6_PSUAM|nr:long-chain-fatty-acid--CoA ligase [Pseudonocardia ammonioxydans]SFO41483.1 fatty-acyl-CoA synthase [Pseudonocardia ammonioxydans]